MDKDDIIDLGVFDWDYIPQPVSNKVKEAYLNNLEACLSKLHGLAENCDKYMMSCKKGVIYQFLLPVVIGLYHSRRIGLGIYDTWFYQWVDKNFAVIRGHLEPPMYERDYMQWPTIQELHSLIDEMLESVDMVRNSLNMAA